MKGFLKYFFATIMGVIVGSFLVVVILMGIVGGIVGFSAASKKVEVASESILKIELKGELTEKGEGLDFSFGDQFAFLNKYKKLGLFEIKVALKEAASDERIKGIYLRFRNVNAGWATLKSIRSSLEEFKKSKKFVVAYSDRFSEKAYYLATAADKIYMYPQGDFEFNGVFLAQPFLKGLLDKLEIMPEIFRVGKFKSAAEPLVLKNFSAENRVQLQKFLDDIWEEFIVEVSGSRKLGRNTLMDYLDRGLVNNAMDAHKYGLIDELQDEEFVLQQLLSNIVKKDEEDEEKHFLEFERYIVGKKWGQDASEDQERIAVIFASGMIVDGVAPSDGIGSDTLVKAIRQARKEEKIKGVVLRVNSPGGSALASDVIWNEIELTKKVKPVYASFGDVAGSGGYYIASGCNKIFSQANTLTGSIGVFGIFFNTREFFNNKTGITFDWVTSNPFADIGSSYRPMKEAEKKLINNEVLRVYDRFTALVQQGRGYKDRQMVENIAQGRLWSGIEAKKLGLVDELGDLDVAIKHMAETLQLKEQGIEVFPKSKGFEKIIKQLSNVSLWGNFFSKVEEKLKLRGIYALMPYQVVGD